MKNILYSKIIKFIFINFKFLNQKMKKNVINDILLDVSHNIVMEYIPLPETKEINQY